ncbi:MAG: RHS repeat protein [Chlamydiae bacterium]|nr:RHS repeat protein [Chlamydiota bacterium]
MLSIGFSINYFAIPYDDQGRLASITIKDNTAKLIIASASFEYFDDKICIKTSDNQEIEYKFKDGRLTEAVRPHKPFVQYEYSAYDKNTLLNKKILPQGRGLEIEYDATCRVTSLKKPAKSDGKMTMVAELLYYDNETEVKNALGQKTKYAFNSSNQLIKIEKLDKTGKVYRTHRNIWGQKKESGNLIAKTTEDGAGNILVLNQYLYDKRGNIIESKLYGNLIGKGTPKIVLNENNELESEEGIDCYKKTFEYSGDGKNLILKEIDTIGNYLSYTYKPSTNLLTSKIAYEPLGNINQRFVYEYNEQNILIKITLDGRNVHSSELTEKHITYITPKMIAPAFGLAETTEEKVIKYDDVRFVKKFQSLFDNKGRVFQEDVFDSNNDLRYSIKFSYDEKGNISSETDPLGNVTSCKFDNNNNLIFKENNQLILNYEYDFENRLISSIGTCFDKQTFKSTNQYDLMGNLLVATDKNENATQFSYDEFGRVIKVSYPEVYDENEKIKTPTYQFLYDLLDNVISITDPKGYVTIKNFTIQANPFLINYPDGTKERFKYDNCGSLHRQVTRDGTLWIYEYDYMGRPNNIEHFSQVDTGPGTFLGNKIREYDLFQCISERDEGYAYTKYLYNLGRLDSVRLNDDDFDAKRFTYDEFNRIKSEEFFTNKESNDSFSKIKEYDLLDRVTEERTEVKGQVLERKKFIYDPSGDLIKNISFSQGKELITTIEYDGLHNPKKIIDPLDKATNIYSNYKFINALNQKVLQRTITDSLGNTQIITHDLDFVQLFSSTRYNNLTKSSNS